MARILGISHLKAVFCALLATACAGPAESQWRAVEPEHLLIIETKKGRTFVELNPAFAPHHTARIQALARAGIYDNHFFYRVIDGFVAQGGVQDKDLGTDWPALENENDRPLTLDGFTPLGNGDLFAREVGHIDGFPVGRDTDLGREWLLHCPGAMAMARDTDPDSGATEFYIVLDAQRYLDRNLTIFGRVLSGMQYVQALERGDRAVANGVIQPPHTGDEILSIRLAADVPEAERPKIDVIDTRHPAFEAAKTARRVREEPFFYRKPPEILDICDFDPPIRRQ